MTSFLRQLLLIILLMTSALPVLAADSDKPQPTITLLVDVQRVLRDAEAAKGVEKLLSAQSAQLQGDTLKEENQLRQAEQDITKAHDHLTADAYNEREQQLRQREVAVERHVDMRRKMLDKSFNDAKNVVQDKFLAIVQAVAHERGATLVLAKQQVLWTDKSLDITDEVLTRLNKALPEVAVKPPEEDKTAK